MHSFHPLVKEKPGRKPFREIKVMKEDAVAVEREAEQIKARYTKIFRV
jgi:iron(III) transport system substrate-binding protein